MNKSLKNKLFALSLTTAIALTAGGAFSEENTFSFGSQIVDATESGNLDGVRSLIAQGANPNDLGEFDTTPLMRAAYHGNNQMVILLLNNGAKPNLKDIGGACALTIAARENYPDVVKTLIKSGADLNIATNDGNTPLAIAKNKKNIEVAELLSNAGAGVVASKNVQTANAKLKPASGTKLADESKVTEQANNISVDFSNGKLDSNSKSSVVQIAKSEPTEAPITMASFAMPTNASVTEKREISASVTTNSNKQNADLVVDNDLIMNLLTKNSFPETLEQKSLAKNNSTTDFTIPSTPNEVKKQKLVNISENTAATKPASVPLANNDSKNNSYQLSADQVISNAGQNSVLNLGTFKSQEFANNKISELKNNYADALNGVELKVVSKAIGAGTSYQVNGGLLASAKANDVCSKLIAAGTNCRVESSNFANQREFSQFTGAPAAVAANQPPPAPKYVEKQDVLGPAKSPDVASQPLPSIADATKPAPVVAAKPSTPIASLPAPIPVNVANTPDMKSEVKSAPVQQAPQPQVLAKAEVMPIPLPQAPANPPPVVSQPSNFDMINSMINSKNSDSPSTASSPKTFVVAQKSLPPISTNSTVAAPVPNTPAVPAQTISPPQIKPVPVVQNTAPAPVTPPPVVAQAEPVVIKHVPAAVTPIKQAPVTTATVAETAPTQPQPNKTSPLTAAPAALTPSPTIVIHSNKSKGLPPQNFAANPPAKPLVAAPAIIPKNKFEVSRPVKVTNEFQAEYPDANPYQPEPSNTYSNRETWVKIDYFVDESAARYYIKSLQAQDPSLANYRIRTTRPLSGGRASAQIGPVESSEVASICNVVNSQNQGYHCEALGSINSSRNYQSNSNLMRHSTLYGSESPSGYERHGYNY